MLRQPSYLPAVLAVLALARIAPAQDHKHAPAPGEKLGKVTFPTSCRPDVQPSFERAVAMLHSFWFEEAEKAFGEVAAADPSCAMAHWGIAMTLLTNPMTRSSPPPPLLQKGQDAVTQAKELAAKASHREQMWIDAAAAAYRDYATVDHLTRRSAHEAAFRALRAAHPEDTEASIFLARTSARHQRSRPHELWKKAFLERGPELFGRESAVEEYERRIAELERLLGQKEVEIALLRVASERAERGDVVVLRYDAEGYPTLLTLAEAMVKDATRRLAGPVERAGATVRPRLEDPFFARWLRLFVASP